MLRFLIVICLITGLMLVGCSKEEEDLRAIEQEAADQNAEAVMDSLEGTGMEAEETGETTTAMTGMTAQEAKQPEMPDYSDLDGYVVQIGSHVSYEFARGMAEKYLERDYPAFVQTVEIDGQVLYRLRIGVYETKEDAEQVGELLVDRYSAEYWLDFNR